jgi:hypothetical protein
MSRPRIAAPRLAAIDCGVLPPRAGGAASAAAKMPFEILILLDFGAKPWSCPYE